MPAIAGRRRNLRITEIVMILLFLSAGFVIDVRIPSHLDIDSHHYLELGQRFYESGRFMVEGQNGQLEPDFSRTPVYPLIISAAFAICSGNVGGAVAIVIWLQRLTWAFAVCFALPAIRPRSGRFRSFTFLAKAILLFSPVVLWHASLLLTDLPYAMGLLLVLVMTLRTFAKHDGARAVRSGVVHGVLTLTRPFHLYAPLLIVLPWIFKWRKGALLLLVPALALPGLWVLRNHGLGQNWTLATIGGRSLALHQQKNIELLGANDAPGEYGPKFLAALHSTNEGPYTAAWILSRDYGLSSAETDAIARDVAIRAIVRHPWRYVGDVSMNVMRLFYSPIDGINLARTMGVSGRDLKIAGFANGLYGSAVFFLLPIALLAYRFPRRLMTSHGALSIALLTVYVGFVPALTTVTYGRFALPLLPMVALVYIMSDSLRGVNEIRSGISKRKPHN